MIRIYNTLKLKGLIAIFLCIALSGCNKWLDVYPENQQAVDEFWKTGEEVEEMLMGTYVQLRACIQQFVRWSEIRGDGLSVVSSTNDEAKVKDMTQLRTENSVCNWLQIYSAINRANAVIKYASGALEEDITFSEALCNSYIAEAIYIRSLCYYYLLRTFGDVPLVTQPYMDDEADLYTPTSDRHLVAQFIIKDLEEWVDKCKPGYETDWENKGRVTRWAYYALLADVCLWEEEFEKASKACDKIISSGQFSLLPSNDWFELFYPGNSQESIFELQWDYNYEQTNSFYTWFFNGTSNPTYIVSQTTRTLFEDQISTDLRGVGGSYILESGYESKIWKYGGTAHFSINGISDSRGTNQRDNNWIFYRYAEVLLMKAEALVMLGENNFSDAMELVSQVRERAGNTTQLVMPDTEREALMNILEERHREFVAEGKRWFDVLRVAQWQEYNGPYRSYLIEVLLAPLSARDRPTWESKLTDPYSYYLPIYKNDVDRSNGVLIQNPFYANQG